MHCYYMAKTNLQIRIPPEMGLQIERLEPKSKSDFVRQAIEEKIRREMFQRLEDQWISALKKYPEITESDTWLMSNEWGPK